MTTSEQAVFGRAMEALEQSGMRDHADAIARAGDDDAARHVAVARAVGALGLRPVLEHTSGALDHLRVALDDAYSVARRLARTASTAAYANAIFR